MFRPHASKVFEPENPEYALIDAVVQESFEKASPEIMWWSLNRELTEPTRDELDQLYGEKSSGDKLVKYAGPFRVYGHLEPSPIIQELTRLGVEQIWQIDLFMNVAAMLEYTRGRPPKPGDVFRATHIHPGDQREYKFYMVGSVLEVDLFNFKYVNWQVNAEQTTLADVPDEIKLYAGGK